MRAIFSGKFADVQRDADQWVKDHPGLNDKAIWTVVVEHPLEEFAYRCPVARRDMRGVPAAPEQSRIRVVGPCCYATIQAALADAKEGDTILVTEVTYGQTSNECYAVVACAACSQFHVVERNSGMVEPIERQTRVQVAGLRK